MACVCFRHKFTLGHSSTFEMTTCLAMSVFQQPLQKVATLVGNTL